MISLNVSDILNSFNDCVDLKQNNLCCGDFDALFENIFNMELSSLTEKDGGKIKYAFENGIKKEINSLEIDLCDGKKDSEDTLFIEKKSTKGISYDEYINSAPLSIFEFFNLPPPAENNIFDSNTKKPEQRIEMPRDLFSSSKKDIAMNLVSENTLNEVPKSDQDNSFNQNLNDAIPENAQKLFNILNRENSEIINDIKSLRFISNNNIEHYQPIDLRTTGKNELNIKKSFLKTEDISKVMIKENYIKFSRLYKKPLESEVLKNADNNFIVEREDSDKESYEFEIQPDINNFSDRNMLNKDVFVDRIKEDKVEFIKHENLFDELSDLLKCNAYEDKKEISIVLHPENLGKLKLKVKSDENGVSAYILTDNKAVKDEIFFKTNEIVENLNLQGFKVNTIEVRHEKEFQQTDLFSGFNQSKEQSFYGQNKQQSYNHQKNNPDEKVNLYKISYENQEVNFLV